PDVLAPAQVAVEAGAEGQQARDVAVHLDHPRRRRDDPGEDLEERALARAIRPDDPERLAVDDVERHVPERPEIGVAALELHPSGERLAGRGPAGELEAVLDPQPVDADRDRAARMRVELARLHRRHQRTFANDGSTRLKSRIA